VQGRQPVLLHRDMKTTPSRATAMIDAAAPGNKVSLTMDWSQSLDVVYGQGTALDGVSFTGMEVSADGSRTFYEPLAYRRQAFPTTGNKWLDTTDMPTEIMLQLQQGLDPAGAQVVAQSHLRHFADPGLTGTVTLASDPTMNGESMPLYLVRAGMDCAIPGLLGRPEPTVLHITDNTCDLVAKTNTLTVDSKFRDALTVREVRKRGRDSLKVARMLVGGQYTPPVPDQLVPWNYNKGSGYIPSGAINNTVELFNGMPDAIVFPWTPWTTARPPKSHHWRNAYAHIGPTDSAARNNWAYRGGGPPAPKGTGGHYGLVIRAAQAGQIRLLQVAAYDKNGNVMKVPFHISFYTARAVNVGAMPFVGPTDIANGSNDGYVSASHYPFAASAWETYAPDGTLANTQVALATAGSGVIRVYGTGFEQAGMYPQSGTTLGHGGSDPRPGGGTATGLLVDESVWPFDTTQQGKDFFDPYSKKSLQPNHAGLIYAMIYCDQQGANDVYFLGRMFRVEPGTGS
jgi:hypothetical protein